MTTVNKHIAMIEEHLQAYKPTDDFSIPRKLILSYMNMIRSALIRQMKGAINSSYYQLVDCLEVRCLERGCSLGGYTIKADDLKYIELPLLVSDMSPDDIKYLGGADLNSKATYLGIDGFMNLEYSKYTSKMFHYTQIGQKILLQNLPDENMKVLTGILLLDNPVDACNWDDETIYPCPSDYRLQVLTIQHILSAYNIYPDEFNNARQDLQSMNVAKPARQQQQTVEDE
ncbi:MAG: hypothetical protein M0R51_17130 [Clostridia bacterium]|jgi:hypothetical protein|nr:hypothetical protein [Clostridia bacterium]